ncbi:VrrA/YqfQ family protein [Geomicrobium sp. JSM 1781026]|uniref:VrrA/YqfQ family protein n=2 Tax=unclassified Geomicrobium TaxID=2628951 RepID=UPI0035C04893
MYGYPPMPLPMGPPAASFSRALPIGAGLPLSSAMAAPGAALSGGLAPGIGSAAALSGGSGMLGSIGRFMPMIQTGAKWIPVIRKYGPMVRQIPGVVRQVNQMRRGSGQNEDTQGELPAPQTVAVEEPVVETAPTPVETTQVTTPVPPSSYTGNEPPPKLYV